MCEESFRQLEVEERKQAFGICIVSGLFYKLLAPWTIRELTDRDQIKCDSW